ncbi:phosphate ABC transporter substrate-binding protein, PhoT family [Nocardioides scoriae]|uniref:Phosphate-binding protein n=1 Tax=Nocardioides scoriae TaxID=642780 RepID=A0A1H1WWB3_9ACTN|nr:phosphate ABC transporter substrate-binding protein PstS [Nocardioides scoriae]SDT00970.1 phosphate ABC transporter substrate-binding protein, PhoT family [Nocardioides scoriae]
MKRSALRRVVAPGVAALTLTMAMSACGAANETGSSSDSGSGSSSDSGSLSGQLAGAGASSQEKAQEAWSTAFQGNNPDVTITYDPAGSGDGRTQFIAGGVDYAGSDAYLTDDEGELTKAKERCGTDAIEIPAYVSPIAVIYNLDGVDDLQLDAKTTAEIFSGKITTWDDPAIADQNPDADLPSSNITAVHRSDDSGTTENFTDWMNQAGDGAWSADADGTWPLKGGEAAEGTSGVVSAVTNGKGTIGYADESQAGDLGIAKIKVGEDYVEASPEAAAKTVEESEPVSGRPDVDMAIEVNRTSTTAGTYPVILVSYLIACQTYDDAAKADAVKAYLSYIVSEEGQQAAADNAGSAPLSSTVADQATGIVEKISAKN